MRSAWLMSDGCSSGIATFQIVTQPSWMRSGSPTRRAELSASSRMASAEMRVLTIFLVYTSPCAGPSLPSSSLPTRQTAFTYDERTLLDSFETAAQREAQWAAMARRPWLAA